MSEPAIPPQGHLPCPNCSQPVLPDAPICPNCGVRLGRGGRVSRSTGIWVLLVGLFLTLAAGALFFFGCLTALGGRGNTDQMPVIMQVSMALGVVGLVVMLVGFILSLIQAFRR